jgi:hypothetical protein
MLLIVAAALLPLSCAPKPAPPTGGPATSAADLERLDARPTYRIQVDDADEAAIVQQEMKLDVVRVAGRDMDFHADAAQLARLKDSDYQVQQLDPQQNTFRVVRIPRRGKEAALLQSTGVTLINREEDYWVVRASVAQLKLLRNAGYKVAPLDHEVRPRDVRILVNEPADVQRVNEMHVDIFSARRDPKGKIVIEGAAFDAQIDALRNARYDVTVLPPRN